MVLEDALLTVLDIRHGRKPAAPVSSRLEVAISKSVTGPCFAKVGCFLQGTCPSVLEVEE
jgi:hypothetical protein